MSTSEMIPNYTDRHDVDEDMSTISEYGGNWRDNNKAGIAYRQTLNNPIESYGTVASR